MRYIFKWELTTNCTYNCPFCALHGIEQFSTNDIYDKVLSFVQELAKDENIDYIKIILFGGECTIHPAFLDIVRELVKIDKIKLTLFTNLSSDIQLYIDFCNIVKDKISEFLITYHEEFADIPIFKNKLKTILDNYNYIDLELFCMVGRNHKTENELTDIFRDLLNYPMFTLLFAPICGENYKIENDNKLEKTYRLKNNNNKRYNKFCTNYYEIESFINSKGILFPCQMVQKYWSIDIPKSDNPVRTFNALKKLKIKCSQLQCCGNMPKEDLNKNNGIRYIHE